MHFKILCEIVVLFRYKNKRIVEQNATYKICKTHSKMLGHVYIHSLVPHEEVTSQLKKSSAHNIVNSCIKTPHVLSLLNKENFLQFLRSLFSFKYRIHTVQEYYSLRLTKEML